MDLRVHRNTEPDVHVPDGERQGQPRDQSTGQPTPIQQIETQKIHPRTFHIDPSGRLLVAEHNLPVNVRDGDAVKTVPAGLSVFRMGDDGKLTFVRKYDIDVGDKTMFWMGMVPL